MRTLAQTNSPAVSPGVLDTARELSLQIVASQTKAQPLIDMERYCNIDE